MSFPEDNILRCKQTCPVEIRPSKRHGMGVFATRDIEKDEALCYYDGEDIKGTHIIHSFALELQNSSSTRIGYYNLPLRTSYGCAQFMNDALYPNLDALVAPDTEREHIIWDKCIQEMQSYMRKSDAASMTYTDMRPQAKYWYFAKRFIRKGEEIVTQYGEHYWIKHILSTTTKVSVLLVIMCIYEADFLENLSPSDEITDTVLKRYKLYDAIQNLWLKLQAEMTRRDVIVTLIQYVILRKTSI